MRKVTARELHQLKVGHGDSIPLPMSPLELLKAQICEELERLYGDDIATWILVLKKLKPRVKKEPDKTAIKEILSQLEGTGNCKRVGSRHGHGKTARHQSSIPKMNDQG